MLGWRMLISGAPDALLAVEGREHYGFVVNFRGVLVDGGCGLSAEVAVTRVEVESADVVGAVGAGKLHASLDACDGVETLHRVECSPLARERKTRGWGGEGNDGKALMWERVVNRHRTSDFGPRTFSTHPFTHAGKSRFLHFAVAGASAPVGMTN
jgi:hypothetical protein